MQPGTAPSFGSSAPGVSLVIPLFNEEAVMEPLLARLSATLEALDRSAEVALVNDGSSDRTAELVDEAVARDSRFVAVHLTRNFGHQAAVSAGMSVVRGSAVAVLDGDLQDPPEVLQGFLAKLDEGYDVVYAVRRRRKEGPLLRLAYRVFYRLLSRLAHIEIPLDAGDFCVMTRPIVDAMNAMPESRRFVRGLRAYAGFRQIGLPYERHARAEGASKYTWLKLLRLASDGIFGFSDIPLRAASVVGGGVAALCVLWSIALVIWRVTTNQPLPGFATLAVAIFFLGAVQLICIGILGEYIGRIHEEVKRRPPYLIARVESQWRTASSTTAARTTHMRREPEPSAAIPDATMRRDDR